MELTVVWRKRKFPHTMPHNASGSICGRGATRAKPKRNRCISLESFIHEVLASCNKAVSGSLGDGLRQRLHPRQGARHRCLLKGDTEVLSARIW
jgi:hypothetical protein